MPDPAAPTLPPALPSPTALGNARQKHLLAKWAKGGRLNRQEYAEVEASGLLKISEVPKQDVFVGSQRRGLTARQQTFADAVCRGCNHSDAARAAGITGTPAVIAQKGYRMAKSPTVQAYLAANKDALIAVAAVGSALSRAVLLDALEEIITKRERDATARDRIAAVAQASKMLGCDAPTKVEMKMEGSLLWQIRHGPLVTPPQQVVEASEQVVGSDDDQT